METERAMPRNLLTAAALPAAPEALYDAYLDPDRHAAITGHPVNIAAHPGAVFSAFEGALSGIILHLEPKRLIVQTWRSVNFAPDDIDSVLVLSFWPQHGGARIELTQVNVAEGDFAGVSRGWEHYYWTPWRAYLEKQSGQD
jgi:activator of HSP90 ATPase